MAVLCLQNCFKADPSAAANQYTGENLSQPFPTNIFSIFLQQGRKSSLTFTDFF